MPANINLLPTEIKKGQQLNRQQKMALSICLSYLIILGVILVLAISGKITIGLTLKARTGEKEILENQLKKEQAIVDQMLFINDRAQAISQIEKQKIDWPAIFAAISQATPEKLQVKTLTANLQAQPPFKLTGQADSNRTAAQFKESLEASKYFKDVTLESLSQITVDEVTVTNFNLNFQLEAKGLPLGEKK